MIKERFCSYEVARLLKKKGFDEPIYEFYDSQGKVLYSRHSKGLSTSELDGEYYPHITHQKACDWLREVHKIFIEISVSIDLNGDYHYSYFILDKNCKYVRKGYTSFDWNFTDAVEEALKYSLENLV